MNRQTLRVQLTRILREAIVSGEFMPGQRLNEPELAKRFGTSLTPVREALNSLAATGLIVRSSRQGTHVRRLSIGDVENLMALREALESLALRQAVPNMSEADDRRLRRILDGQAQATDLAMVKPKDALPRLVAKNEQFHRLIIERSGNEWLVAMLSSIWDLVEFARGPVRQLAAPARRLASLQEHMRIAEALILRDVEVADRHLRSHVRCTRDHVLALMQERMGAGRTEAPVNDVPPSPGDWGLAVHVGGEVRMA